MSGDLKMSVMHVAAVVFTFLCLLIVSEGASLFPKSRVERSADAPHDLLDPFAADGGIDGDDGEAWGEYPALKRADDSDMLFPPSKRYICRQYFVWNPVKGKCQPTRWALRKGRK